MQFRKSLLCSNISLILSAGVFLSQAPGVLAQNGSGDLAQTSGRGAAQWNCTADAAGNWQCSENPAAARTPPSGVVTSSQDRRGQGSNQAQTRSTAQGAAAQWVSSDQMTPEQRAA